MRRRWVLAATTSLTIIGLAGCFGNNDTDSPRSVVRAYLEAEYDDGDPELMAELLHSESPLDPTAGESDIETRSVEIDTISVDNRSLSSDRIDELPMGLSAETAERISEQEHALVDATYEVDPPELADGSSDVPPSGRIAVENSYLTAVDNDDWLIVAFRLL